MEKNKKKEYSKEKSGNEMQVLFIMVGLLVSAWVAKNDVLIKTWFFDNMFKLILIGIGLLAALGYYLNYRFKKNNQEFLERAQKLQMVKTTKPVNHYYQRNSSKKNSNKGDSI